MKTRIAAIALAFVLGGALMGTSACSGPYSGKAEKLKKPSRKPKPPPTEEELAAAAAGPQLDDKCRTNFFDDPKDKAKKRKAKEGLGLAKEADPMLFEAEAKEGMDRISKVKEAMSKLRNSLEKDPYGPEATYKLAVAYALVNKKGCSIALLTRLKELEKFPDVEAESGRVIKRVLGDPAFDLFRKDANAAVGQ